MISNYPDDSELCTKPEEKCWLSWKWLKQSPYWYLWFVSGAIPFLALSDTTFSGIFPVLYLFVSYIISFTISTNVKYISKSTLWCLLQVLMPVFILALG